MTNEYRIPYTAKQIKNNLARLKRVINGPYVRQADFTTRDRWARRLREVSKANGKI